MTPVAFGDCFGWLHAPPAEASDVAVLIGAGLMRDRLLAHASLRLLADDLAAAGYWVLRFDHPGTGDALDGDIEQTGHWTAWQDAQREAADWLKKASGARRLVLCGVRIGATLATLSASERDDVAGLLLFDPVIVGRTYMRQLVLEAELQGGRSQEREEGLEIREFRFSPATVKQMSAIDLRRTTPPAAAKVAVFAPTDNRQINDGIAAWNGAGVTVSHEGWDGLQPMVRHPVFDESPLGDFSGVVRWLAANVPTGIAAPAPHEPVQQEATLHPEGCIERPLRFGPEGRLFGMLCIPAGPSTDEIVLLLNGGRDPHYGAARQGIGFARSLAQAGIATLRADFAGLGDSPGPTGHERILSRTFADRTTDIRAMVDAVQPLGFRRIAALGLCSGAYHAVQGALAEPRIITLLPINMPLFVLPQGNVLDQMDQRGFTPGYYLRKMGRWRSWVTLLSGRSDLRGIWRMQRARGRNFLGRLGRATARRLGIARHEPSVAERTLATLSSRGVRMLFLFSPGDADIENFAREFGPAGEKLAAYPGATMCIVPSMDHDLTRLAGQRDAAHTVVEFLKGRR